MIRDYQPEDLTDVMRIANKAWQPIYDMYEICLGGELANLRNPERDTTKGEQLRKFCRKTPAQVLICEEAGKVVGFLTYSIHEEMQIGEIGNNAVDPDCGLKGMGQQMYKAVLELFREKGVSYAMVGTGLDDAHAPARRAYERAGFNLKLENVTYFQKL